MDYLDFGLMGRIEAWKGRFGLSFDTLYMDLSADNEFRSRREIAELALDADVRIGTADTAYRS